MDFNVDDSTESSSEYNNNNERKKVFKLVIIILVSAVVGFSVYFITDKLINKPQAPQEIPAEIEMELSDEMVRYLYDGVTYDADGLGVRSNAFFKNDEVTAADFSIAERLYLALRYASVNDFVPIPVEDKKPAKLEESDKKDDAPDMETLRPRKEEHVTTTTNKHTTINKTEVKVVVPKYTIGTSIINNYMYDFFGEDYGSVDSTVDVVLKFKANNLNQGTFKYDKTKNCYVVELTKTSPNATSLGANPYLYELISAKKIVSSNDIVIREKVVFTSTKQYTDADGKPIDKYDCTVYSDVKKSNVIDERKGVSRSQLLSLSISDYEDNASTYEHTFFKDDNDEYHYSGSKLVTE